ncbi:DNA-binding protein [Streptomyces sp. NPDC008001]|uniref:DNA-binding protein n=1 Tax=Streptomyces sp. NPDC008001 TaxID=3364804 RepID=UPI0036E94124
MRYRRPRRHRRSPAGIARRPPPGPGRHLSRPRIPPPSRPGAAPRVGRAYRFTAEHLAEIIRLYEERPAQPAQTAARATEPLSEPGTQTDFAQRRRPAVAPATRLRARPPRRQQQYSTVA